jgi:putative glutamine amidotransferase
VLNVLGGGTLVPEVKDAYGGIAHGYLAKDEPFKWAEHEVEAEPGNPVSEALGERFEVMSSHHQAVAEVAPGWEVAARSSDGLVEAIYDPEHPFVVGVQWHPEAGADPTIFAALAEAGRRRRAERAAESASQSA